VPRSTPKAFGIHFVTFLVAFAVVCSGTTSASTSANVLAQNFFGGLAINGWMGLPGWEVVTAVALGFMLLLAAINLCGVGERVKFNVALTLVEMIALCIVIGVGFYMMAQGPGTLEKYSSSSTNRTRARSWQPRRPRPSPSLRWSALRTS
jgi:APA family basic amino acid/polyamine antiporter